jgi:hypothetical protein
MTNDTIELAVDGLWGIYAPARFFELYPQFLEHLNEDEQAIMSDPYHEQYNDVWDAFVRDFEVKLYADADDHRWNLYQDDDIFFVRDDHQWDE